MGNEKSRIVIVAPMTSRNKTALPTHVLLSKNDYDMYNNSIVLTEQARAIDKGRINPCGYLIDKLNEQDIIKLDRAIKISLQVDKTNTKVEIEINKIAEEIKSLEGFMMRWVVNKKMPISGLGMEIKDRRELLKSLYDICNANNINPHTYYNLMKDFEQNLINASIKNNEMAV
jgi:mRNA-degrading endonuclease toxin of MazEF toxin-antitoxin module